MLARHGKLQENQIRCSEVAALVDTGAVNCVLPQALVKTLGLERPFTYLAQYADGRQEEVDVTEPVLMEILLELDDQVFPPPPVAKASGC
jgi:predicted aspartyl protease